MRLLRNEEKGGTSSRIIEVRKAYIIRVKVRKFQKKAIGGFYESMMAMIIVTVAVLILTSSLSFVSSADGGATDLYSKCRLAAERLLSNQTIMDGESINFHSIQWIDPDELITENDLETSIMIIEIQNGRSALIFSNSTERMSGEVASFTTPMTVSHSASDVRAALLTVSIWEE